MSLDGTPARAVLVTGGAGYIGSHICLALSSAGYLPIAFDNLLTGHAAAVRWGPLEIGDVLDSVRLRSVIGQYRPAAVFHLAGLASVLESTRSPDLYHRVNALGAEIVAGEAARAGIRFLVFSSTCAVYGATTDLPITEATATAPISPYGQSKLEAERVLRLSGQSGGPACVILRYFNAAGAEPDHSIGEAREPAIRAMPLAVMAALGRIPLFHLYGTDYPTMDGTACRDYVHVADLAAGHIAALRHLERGAAGGVYNLGAGRAWSLLQLLEAVEKVTGRAVPYERHPRRPGDPAEVYASSARAEKELGWTPRRSSLEQMVDDTFRWIDTGGPEALRRASAGMTSAGSHR